MSILSVAFICMARVLLWYSTDDEVYISRITNIRLVILCTAHVADFWNNGHYTALFCHKNIMDAVSWYCNFLMHWFQLHHYECCPLLITTHKEDLCTQFSELINRWGELKRINRNINIIIMIICIKEINIEKWTNMHTEIRK